MQPNREILSLLSDSEDDFSTSKLKHQSIFKPSRLLNPIDFTKSTGQLDYESDSDKSLPLLSELITDSASMEKSKSDLHSETNSVEVKKESDSITAVVTKVEK